jgi:hypothetical protein
LKLPAGAPLGSVLSSARRFFSDQELFIFRRVDRFLARRLGEKRFSVVLLLLYGLVIILRSPSTVFSGRFWAEEAVVYFQYALTHSPLDALLASHVGYYNLVANLATLVAARAVPLEFAPLLTQLFAFFVQLLPAILVVTGSLFGRPLWKAFALAVLLFAAPSQELWLNTINSQSSLCVVACLILVSEARNGRERTFHNLSLVVAGLTGVSSTFLTPLFWLSAVTGHHRTRWVQATLLSACAAVQLFVVVAALEGGTREVSMDMASLACVVFIKGLLLPLTGHSFTFPLAGFARTAALEKSADFGLILVALLFAGAWLLFFYRGAPKSSMFLLAASIVVWTLSYLGGVEDKRVLIDSIAAHRYSFAPVLFFVFSLLLLAAREEVHHPRRSRVLTLLLLWVIAVGLSDFGRSFGCLRGPDWKSEVELWREDPNHRIAVWPPGWYLLLQAPTRSAP